MGGNIQSLLEQDFYVTALLDSDCSIRVSQSSSLYI